MPALYFTGGFVLGGLLVYLITRLHRRDVEKSFSALSLDALRRNSEDFFKLANVTLSQQTQAGTGELDTKKKLIDQTLLSMNGELEKVKQSVLDFDRNSGQKLGEVCTQLKSAAEQTRVLHDTTYELKSALADNKARGQWGERMAEDVLRLAGFVEGINYLKQKTQDSVASRPDYTFMLPQELKLNMDVKFPFTNYDAYTTEQAEAAREALKQQFLKDVRQRIKEVTTRDYINPQEKTLDYVLVFVPNEQVYCFINENDRSLIDDALRSRVVLCSPFTLYAILAVIRQAADNFNLSKTGAQIMASLGEFDKQWQEFKKCMDAAGRHIEAAQSEFQKLSTTRANKLETVLNRMEDLRASQPDIPEPAMAPPGPDGEV